MPLSPELAQQLERALHGLRYGSVQLVIHDALVVRIERIERQHLPVPCEAGQRRLTVSSEALSVTQGQPTDAPEVRPDVV